MFDDGSLSGEHWIRDSSGLALALQALIEFSSLARFECIDDSSVVFIWHKTCDWFFRTEMTLLRWSRWSFWNLSSVIKSHSSESPGVNNQKHTHTHTQCMSPFTRLSFCVVLCQDLGCCVWREILFPVFRTTFLQRIITGFISTWGSDRRELYFTSTWMNQTLRTDPHSLL